VKLSIKIFAFGLVTFTFITIGCRPTSSLSIDTTTSNTTDKNNIIIETSTNVLSNKRAHDQIIFEGSNNLFELVRENSSYFDETHDVIIIKGNNTIIKLININILDLSSDSMDTLVIVGNNKKYVIETGNAFVISKKTTQPDTIRVTQKSFDISPYRQETPYDTTPIRLEYFDSLVTAQYAYNYFLKKLSTEEAEYYYQLAEMYFYGLGVQESPEKAIELYEYAAAKDHIPSLIKLGNIFKGTVFVKPDKNKSRYFFKRCSALGDNYCEQQLRK
jgi:hypothetical protein